MKERTRKVLKLGVSTQDLGRFVKAHEELRTKTLSATLTALLDAYEGRRFESILNDSSLMQDE